MRITQPFCKAFTCYILIQQYQPKHGGHSKQQDAHYGCRPIGEQKGKPRTTAQHMQQYDGLGRWFIPNDQRR